MDSLPQSDKAQWIKAESKLTALTQSCGMHLMTPVPYSSLPPPATTTNTLQSPTTNPTGVQKSVAVAITCDTFAMPQRYCLLSIVSHANLIAS